MDLEEAFESQDDIVTLVDISTGEAARYEMLDIIEYNDEEYAVLCPLLQGDEGVVDIFIYRFEGDDLVEIEDEDEFNTIVTLAQALSDDE